MRLCEVFGAADAEHVFQAARARCDVFLTDDLKTIIKRAHKRTADLEPWCGGMRFLTIDELAARLSSPPSGT